MRTITQIAGSLGVVYDNYLNKIHQIQVLIKPVMRMNESNDWETKLSIELDHIWKSKIIVFITTCLTWQNIRYMWTKFF